MQIFRGKDLLADIRDGEPIPDNVINPLPGTNDSERRALRKKLLDTYRTEIAPLIRLITGSLRGTYPAKSGSEQIISLGLIPVKARPVLRKAFEEANVIYTISTDGKKADTPEYARLHPNRREYFGIAHVSLTDKATVAQLVQNLETEAQLMHLTAEPSGGEAVGRVAKQRQHPPGAGQTPS